MHCENLWKQFEDGILLLQKYWIIGAHFDCMLILNTVTDTLTSKHHGPRDLRGSAERRLRCKNASSFNLNSPARGGGSNLEVVVQ